MLKTRILLVLVFSCVVLGILFIPGTPGGLLFGVLAIALIVGALHEAFGLLRCMNVYGYERLTTIFAVLLGISVVVAGLCLEPEHALKNRFGTALVQIIWPLELFLLCVFVIFGIHRISTEEELSTGIHRFLCSVALLSLLYGTLGLGPKIYFVYGIHPAGRILLLFLIAVTKSGDIGAYVVGTGTERFFGNHKIVPRLSPKKSWEGLVGGLIFGGIVAGVLTPVCAEFLPEQIHFLKIFGAILFGMGCGVVGFIADLAVSIFKRAAGVKDSGRLPGLGGLLDITDSLLLTIPIFYTLLWII